MCADDALSVSVGRPGRAAIWSQLSVITVAARPLGPGGTLASGIAMRLAGVVGLEASELEGDRIFVGAGLDSRCAKLVAILLLLGFEG